MVQKAGLMGGGAGVRKMARPWGAISLSVWSRRQVDSFQNGAPRPLTNIFIQSGDLVAFPATTEFLKMMHDLNTGTGSDG